MAQKKETLFICHATEDKPSFVRELAEALRERYDVWYDEYSITLGDSLRQKIDSGLRKCDFGIVVLSKAFFEKDWAQKELDALLTLESGSRKIILPIWKGVTLEDVKRFSPLLAGRFAVKASLGIDAVVSAIEAAVDSSERTKQMDDLAAARDALKTLSKDRKSKREGTQIIQSERGVEISTAAFDTLVALTESELKGTPGQGDHLAFSFFKNSRLDWFVRTVEQLSLRLRIENMYGNDASHAKLLVEIYKHSVRGPVFGEQPEPISNDEFDLSIVPPDTVVWTSEGDVKSTHQMVKFSIDRLIAAIDDASSGPGIDLE